MAFGTYDPSSLFGLPVWAILIVTIWVIIWKGLALWKSARKRQSIWFIVLLIVNTLGLLEILYLFIFSELGKKSKKVKKRK